MANDNAPDTPEIGYFKGEGGGIFAYDLPLDVEALKRQAKGELQRVNKDGSPWVEPQVVAQSVNDDQGHLVDPNGPPPGVTVVNESGATDTVGSVPDGSIALPNVPVLGTVSSVQGLENDGTVSDTAPDTVAVDPVKPKATDSKEAWVEYAKSQGLEDADSFTKADLISNYKEH